MSNLPRQNTVGAIAEAANQPVHRIEYLIDARKIEPIARAGNCRVFSDSDTAYLISEARRIVRDRESGLKL